MNWNPHLAIDEVLIKFLLMIKSEIAVIREVVVINKNSSKITLFCPTVSSY